MVWKKVKWLVALLGVSIVVQLLFVFVPKEVVFDEVHFGKFVTAYCCTGERFFDIHPPHAKLLIAGTAWLSGYRGNFDFDHIGESYGDISVFSLRLLPMLSGVLLPLAVYLLITQLGAGRITAFSGGLLVLFDNAVRVQTMIMVLDGLLLLFTFAGIGVFLWALKQSGWRYWTWLLVSGGLVGLAAGVKFTGLAALALLGVIILVNLFKNLRKWKHWILVGLLVLFTAAFVYLLGWAMHFNLLSSPGAGDAFHKPVFNSDSIVKDFFRETYELHKIMLSVNYGLQATHPDASSWWSWPLMKTSVFYWSGDRSMIYFLGNPAIWWGSTVMLFLIVVREAIAFGQGKKKDKYMLWIPLVGYFISFIPLMRVPRVLFLYHYLTPLVFLIILSMVWLEKHGYIREDECFLKQRVLLWGMVIVVSLFIFFAPLTFGFRMPKEIHQMMFWFNSWR